MKSRNQPRAARKSTLFGRKSSSQAHPSLPLLSPEMVSSAFQDNISYSPLHSPTAEHTDTATLADDDGGSEDKKSGVGLSLKEVANYADGNDKGVTQSICKKETKYVGESDGHCIDRSTSKNKCDDHQCHTEEHLDGLNQSPVSCAATIGHSRSGSDPMITTATNSNLITAPDEDPDVETGGSCVVEAVPQRRPTLLERLRGNDTPPVQVGRASLVDLCANAVRTVQDGSINSRMSLPVHLVCPTQEQVGNGLEIEHQSMTRDISSPFYFLKNADEPGNSNERAAGHSGLYENDPSAEQEKLDIEEMLGAARAAVEQMNSTVGDNNTINDNVSKNTNDNNRNINNNNKNINNGGSTRSPNIETTGGRRASLFSRLSTRVKGFGKGGQINSNNRNDDDADNVTGMDMTNTAVPDRQNGTSANTCSTSTPSRRRLFGRGWIHGTMNSIRKMTSANETWKAGVYEFNCEGQRALQEVRSLLERDYFGVIVSEHASEIRMRVPLTVEGRLSLINIVLLVEHHGEERARVSIRRSFRDALVVRHEDFDWFCFDVFRRLLKHRDVVRPFLC